MSHPIERRRQRVGVADEVCSVCGHQGLTVMESERVRKGLARIQFWASRHRRWYKLCASCGSRSEMLRGRRRA